MRRIGERTNSAIFLLLTSFSISAIAEPKMLVCESSAEAEEKRLRGFATEYQAAGDMESANNFGARADECKNSKYGWQNTFTFDTAGLSSAEFSNVEVQRTGCGDHVSDVVKGTIEATPTTITFKWVVQAGSNPYTWVFNVDRKNLTSGVGTKRDFTCVLSDIDTSENLL